uniref:Beta-adaptin-like protein n=1 Tax=Rhizophora mucronata TaxID=61149 RepID=A0A2P2JS16_RHIMU
MSIVVRRRPNVGLTDFVSFNFSTFYSNKTGLTTAQSLHLNQQNPSKQNIQKTTRNHCPKNITNDRIRRKTSAVE